MNGTPQRTDEQWIRDYQSGRLSEAEAEAFEARLMADDALAAELERAIEIRAVLRTNAAPAAQPRPRRAPRPWVPLALAAGAALVAAGVFWMRSPQPTAPVFRGAEQQMGVSVEVSDRRLHAQWAPVSGAARYELRLLHSNGAIVISTEIDTPSADLALPIPKPAFVEVAALDDLGQTLIRSQRIALDETAR